MLGYPANPDGRAGEVIRERVAEAVKHWRLGAAPKIVMTGAGVHTKAVEADVMAYVALTDGVPDSAVMREREARNTFENISKSLALSGAKSALVVTSPSHAPRASIFLSRHPVEYRVVSAPPRGWYGLLHEAGAFQWETWKLIRLRVLP